MNTGYKSRKHPKEEEEMFTVHNQCVSQDGDYVYNISNYTNWDQPCSRKILKTL